MCEHRPAAGKEPERGAVEIQRGQVERDVGALGVAGGQRREVDRTHELAHQPVEAAQRIRTHPRLRADLCEFLRDPAPPRGPQRERRVAGLRVPKVPATDHVRVDDGHRAGGAVALRLVLALPECGQGVALPQQHTRGARRRPQRIAHGRLVSEHRFQLGVGDRVR